jgi:precorrin-2/cobalt-factor-2 C20-methyltransferase
MDMAITNSTTQLELTDFRKALPGHFYAVGVGPGAPDLVTLRAARLIETADVIIAPRSRRSEQSLALETVSDLIGDQEIVDHVYFMQRDVSKTMACWMSIADLSVQRCRSDKSVVQITLGDPLVYSTSCYLLSLIGETLPEEAIHVVPGISAFQATACLFGQALTSQEDRMLMMPATDLSAVAEALGQCETLVLYKAGKHIAQLADLLEQKGLLAHAKLACYAEQGQKQFLSTNLRDASNGAHGYMATVIVNIGRRTWAGKTESEAE